jgi:hypothetical protein
METRKMNKIKKIWNYQREYKTHFIKYPVRWHTIAFILLFCGYLISGLRTSEFIDGFLFGAFTILIVAVISVHITHKTISEEEIKK